MKQEQKTKMWSWILLGEIVICFHACAQYYLAATTCTSIAMVKIIIHTVFNFTLSSYVTNVLYHMCVNRDFGKQPTKKKKKDGEDSDSEEEDDLDLSDEETLGLGGVDDKLKRAFEREMMDDSGEEEGEEGSVEWEEGEVDGDGVDFDEEDVEFSDDEGSY